MIRPLMMTAAAALALSACAPSHVKNSHAMSGYGDVQVVKSRYGTSNCAPTIQCGSGIYVPQLAIRPAPQPIYVPPPIYMAQPAPTMPDPMPPIIEAPMPAPVVEAPAPYIPPAPLPPLPEVVAPLPEIPSWTPGDAAAWPEPERPPIYTIPRK